MSNDKEDTPIVDPFAIDDTVPYEQLHASHGEERRRGRRYKIQTLRFFCCMPPPYLIRTILILSIFNVFLTLLMLVLYVLTNDYVWKLLTVT